ncbi:hypothetical protein SK128_005577 [Halocaridina rubra]|uniref:Uncharacterized protein n=1 Tax=Halocaridina rubra TaxID=373956 RepID=A0AAN9ACD6_HALRR
MNRSFFVTKRDLQKALKSPNPTAYISTIFLKHLFANSTLADMVGDINSPMLEKSIQTFLDWVIPNIDSFTGKDINPSFFHSENEIKSRRKRDLGKEQEGNIDDDDGWITIGGQASEQEKPTASLMSHGSVISPLLNVQHNRVLWSDEHVLSHNHIDDIDRRPDLDEDEDRLFPSSPRPFSTRPTLISSIRPTDTYVPSTRPTISSIYPIPNYPSSSGAKPPFHLTSFDDLPSTATGGQKRLDISTRLSRLDYFFSNLHLDHEECRRRVLCEVSREPETFSPLSDVINGETRFQGDFRELSRELLNTAEGARLLSYIEAVKLGEDRLNGDSMVKHRTLEVMSQTNVDQILPWTIKKGL